MPQLRWSPIIVLAAAVLAAVSLYEGMQVAQRAGEFEIEARQARAAVAIEVTRAAASTKECRRLRDDGLRLERELDGALEWSKALGEALAAESERREQAAVHSAAAAALVANPPPFGVQRCLLAVRDCLRADGFLRMQLLRARALEQKALLDVEFLEFDEATGSADVVVAARMAVALDRTRSEVVLRFDHGHRRRDGVRIDLPESGYEVRLAPVDGHLWEQRLPFLMQVVGEYLDPDAPARAAEDAIDARTRAIWLERLDDLLVDAGADYKLRVAGFTGLAGGAFRSVRVVGYDSGNVLALAADCEQLSIEVDQRARVVSLLLKSGTLRRQGTESSIHTEGYRMLLPNITPEKAAMTMMGMVVQR
jgi:hypothetical protein